ncbi:MAG: FkbM family methyltransferase [Chloroflexota bacterium]
MGVAANPEMDSVTRWSAVPGGDPIRLVSSYAIHDYYYRDCEMETKAWFVSNVGRDWVVLDVGANVGIYSILSSRLAPEGHIHAFEPTSTADILRANLAAEGAGNVTVHQVAISSCAGTREEALYRIWDLGTERMTCPFTTIDQFVAKVGLTRLDLIKIDIDGFDLEALHGAEQTLKRFDPWVVVELAEGLHSRHMRVGDALAWLRSAGYEGPRAVLDGGNYLYRRRPPAADPSRDAGLVTGSSGPRAAAAPLGGRPGGRKVIAFSLYGSYLTYVVGAIMNAQLARQHYPEFTCRFYHDSSVPRWTLDILGRMDHVELVDMTGRADEYPPMFWRFLAAADPEIDIYLCRDTDSRFSARERAAVNEWLASGQRYHIMRDHPLGHGNPIVGCMWGCRGGALREIERLIRDSGPHENRYGTDEQFLWDVVYPMATASMLVHDEHYQIEPDDFAFKRRFPLPPDYPGQFVGQALDEQGNDRHAHQYQ